MRRVAVSLAWLALVESCAAWSVSATAHFPGRGIEWAVECAQAGEADQSDGCMPNACKRVLVDDFVTPEQAQQLILLAERAISIRANVSGPTIVDLSSGFIRDANGLVNMYSGSQPVAFSDEEYAMYRGVVNRIRLEVMARFGLSHLHFTAPTFITRLVGDEEWSPKGIHDEYWHRHVDKVNTEHYDYSGLIYLNNHGTDFTGGKLYFFDSADGADAVDEAAEAAAAAVDAAEGRERQAGEVAHLVEPRAGRLLVFSSGTENPHQVTGVVSGVRYLIAMWFTCDPSREFVGFMDGRPDERHRELARAREAKRAARERRKRRRVRSPSPTPSAPSPPSSAGSERDEL